MSYTTLHPELTKAHDDFRDISCYQTARELGMVAVKEYESGNISVMALKYILALIEDWLKGTKA